ncbi:hypothetical protein NPIL_486541, partial [Nephila pilipes]
MLYLEFRTAPLSVAEGHILALSSTDVSFQKIRHELTCAALWRSPATSGRRI